jgi:hypothetical protein
MTQDLKHKITVQGAILNFTDKEVSFDVALEIARLANQESSGVPDIKKIQQVAPIISDLPSISPSEFIKKYKAKTNTEKILVFARYVQDVLKKDVVSIDDVKIQFEKSREPLPGNFGRDLGRVINYGWLGESSLNKGSYYVTSSGSKTMEEGFPKNNQHSARSKGGKLAPTIVGDEIKKLTIDSEDEELPSYFSVFSKADRMLWLVAKAKKLGVEKINQKEVCFLSVKVGDDLPLKSISSYAEGQRKKGYLTTPLESGTRFLRILEEGIKYLKSLKK